MLEFEKEMKINFIWFIKLLNKITCYYFEYNLNFEFGASV